MSDSGWTETKTAWNRLVRLCRDMDPEIRTKIIMEHVGIGLMGAAIMCQFGWIGVMFCVGFIGWWTGKA